MQRFEATSLQTFVQADFVEDVIARAVSRFTKSWVMHAASVNYKYRNTEPMTEHELYGWIRKELHHDMDVTRIENVAGAGLPDINLCYTGVEVWVECKVGSPRQVLLRPEQYAWSMRRSNHGGSCFVLNWEPNDGLFFVWRFPSFEVQPYSKYVRIMSLPHETIDKNARILRKIFFPMF